VKKNKSNSFNRDWLTEFSVETAMPDETGCKCVKLKEIFQYCEAEDVVVCRICLEAEVQGDWSTGKNWGEWKIDYLKRHVTHRCHLDAVTKLKNLKHGYLLNFLRETPEERSNRLEHANRDRASPEEVKILIGNVLLAIKLNTSMLAVQEIHDYVENFVKIPASWRSKNYAFEFTECINGVIKNQILSEIRESPFHTLIIDESTDISTSKMLIMYIKFRRPGDDIHKQFLLE